MKMADNNIFGTTGGDTLDGTEGDDIIFGDAGDDVINAAGGNDTIIGSSGNDTIDGGEGVFDEVSFTDSPNGVTASLNTDTGTGEAEDGFGTTDTFTGIEVIEGSAFGDTLSLEGSVRGDLNGDGGNDTLTGGDGDDFISGGEGDDEISGGGGNDNLVGGAGNDIIDGGEGDQDQAAFFDATQSVVATLNTDTGDGSASNDGFGTEDTLFGIEVLQGSAFDDTLTLTGSGGGSLSGDGGADSLTGGDGDDFISGGEGDDEISGGGGNDNLVGGAGNDIIDGGDGEFDNVAFFDATQPVVATLNTDTGGGSASNDGFGTEDTFTGIEDLQGGAFNDMLTLTGSGGGSLSGDEGADTLTGSDGDNFIAGGDGDDIINGGGGNDFIVGGAGNDTIDGGDGEFDTAAFFDALSGVTAEIDTDTGSGTVFDDGQDGMDLLSNVEGLNGGSFNDTLTLLGSGNGNLFGDAGADTLIGSDGENFIEGGEGDDEISGGGGNDNLVGGAGNDTIDGGEGDQDQAAFFDATQSVVATLNTDTGDGSASNDGFGTEDTLFGIENLQGGAFNDTLTLTGSGGGALSGDEGADTLTGSDGDNFYCRWRR